MRRRRLIFRSLVFVAALAGAVALTIGSLVGPGLSIGLFFLAILLYIVAAVELPRLVAAVRDHSPDIPPPGRWWICELPRDHRLVRLAGPSEAPPTWRCTRCGHEQDRPNPRSIADSIGAVEQGWVTRHDDM